MKNRKGFTLIELLVVIAIISILAAILFPVFATAKAKGHQIACMSNMRQLGMAITLYVQDSDDLYPGANWATDADPPAPPFDIEGGGLFSHVKTGGVYVCSSDTQAGIKHLSYELNAQLMNIPESAIEKPTDTVLLLDAWVNDSAFVVDSDLEAESAIGAYDDNSKDPPTADVMNPLHIDRANVLYADGHVSSVMAGQLTAGMLHW